MFSCRQHNYRLENDANFVNHLHGHPESQSAGGVGISTPWGEVSCVYGFRSRHVTLSCPGDAYFVYESCPMRDQTKLTCFYFRLIKLESEILSRQNRKRCSRVVHLQQVSDLPS